MEPIAACLWFDGQAQEAAEYYVSVFPNSAIEFSTPIMVGFSLNGRAFQGLNGGPHFTFSEAVSFVVSCADQAEVDHYWATLTEEGEESMCGWLKDRFGVSWQIVPTAIGEVLGDPDPDRAARAHNALMGMRRIDLAALRAAADNDTAPAA